MTPDPKAGACNLLRNCLNVRDKESVLLVLEPTEDLYKFEVGAVIRECLREMDVRVTEVTPPLISDPSDFPDSVADPMRQCDHTVFLSRIGDYVRFVSLPGNGSRATSYTQNAAMLASPYATIDNRLMLELQLKLEDELMRAGEWKIQCPLGTDLTGKFSWPSLSGGEDADLTVALFPVTTFKPVPCDTANGTVALSRWLMPGGAAKLENADMTINGVVLAHIADGCLESFSGCSAEVSKLNRHYDYISESLEINRNRIHSWHAGINPQTRFDLPADDHLDLWSAISFGSPRYLHFHTCGDEPPGEVAWSVFNPSVWIDGTPYWDNGELVWLQRADNKALIESCDGAGALLQRSLAIGIDQGI
ncbi:hypothetical protein AB833_09155 [Chromatiales bacterium (ex Bugula neritina AB1)]|nr:hypothetical protein AB833_09155 [Chromatiales bacterium (ex Bugula neritina AB1)]